MKIWKWILLPCNPLSLSASQVKYAYTLQKWMVTGFPPTKCYLKQWAVCFDLNSRAKCVFFFNYILQERQSCMHIHQKQNEQIKSATWHLQLRQTTWFPTESNIWFNIDKGCIWLLRNDINQTSSQSSQTNLRVYIMDLQKMQLLSSIPKACLDGSTLENFDLQVRYTTNVRPEPKCLLKFGVQ